MLIKKLAVFAAITLSLAATQLQAQATSVQVQALLGDVVVVMINGQRKMLKVGQSFGGVTLLSAQPTEATLDINGRQQTLGLSRHITTNFQQPKEQRLTIARDALMQYQTNALVNGLSVRVLVDTGANVVAISSTQATAMGIDYSAGRPSSVETASGIAGAYAVILQSVSVGGIRVNNVPAMIVEGDFPGTILLGMSYLRHVKMQEHNGILSLSRTP